MDFSRFKSFHLVCVKAEYDETDISRVVLSRIQFNIVMFFANMPSYNVYIDYLAITAVCITHRIETTLKEALQLIKGKKCNNCS